MLAAIAFVAACLPFAVVVGLWARAGFVGDRVTWRGDRCAVVISTNAGGLAAGGDFGDWSKFPRPGGRLSYERGGREAFESDMTAFLALSVTPGDRLYYGRRAGLAWFRYVPRNGSYSINRASAPSWLLGLVTALPPAGLLTILTVRTSRRRRREAHGRCSICGYDLRSSFGLCPECGTEVAVVTWKELDNQFVAPPLRPATATLSGPAGRVECGGTG